MKRTSFSLRRTLVAPASLAFALVTFAAPPAALAQQHSAGDIAQARELFNQGMDLRDKGDKQGALEKLKAAHALAGTPVTGVELGRTYMMLGSLVEARETFLSIGRIPVQPAETSRSTAARTEAAQLADQLRPRIPSLAIKITGVPEDSVSVTLDGAAVPTAALAAPRLVNPGEHTLVATSTTGGRADTKVTLKEGETREVELKIAFTSATAPAPSGAAPQPATAPTTSAPPAAVQPIVEPVPHHVSPLVYAGFGLAGAGLAVGAVTGLMAFNKASAVKDACVGTTCPKSVDDDLQSGRTMGTISTIAFAAAGVGAAVGVVGIILSNKHASDAPPAAARVEPWIGVGSAGVSGTF